jgi:TFIIF-interacting CTD phosphatase-like protein
LDQTLISAEEIKGFEFQKYRKKILQFDTKVMDDLYIIFGRPHLQTFLDYLFENFNVSIWTAASKSYALFIINNFIKTKPNRKIDFIFFSYHCDFSMKSKKGLKCLSLLWEVFGLNGFNIHNTIIIDDNDRVKKIQKCNCYAIEPFNFTDVNCADDTALLQLKLKLEHMSQINETTLNQSECLIDLL